MEARGLDREEIAAGFYLPKKFRFYSKPLENFYRTLHRGEAGLHF